MYVRVAFAFVISSKCYDTFQYFCSFFSSARDVFFNRKGYRSNMERNKFFWSINYFYVGLILSLFLLCCCIHALIYFVNERLSLPSELYAPPSIALSDSSPLTLSSALHGRGCHGNAPCCFCLLLEKV